MFKSILAVAVLASFVVPSCQAQAQVEAADVLKEVAKAGYELYQAWRNDGNSLEQATSDILQAIASARTDILNHMDALAAAEARACARAGVIDFENIESMDLITKQVFALDLTYCLALLHDLIADLLDQSAVDELGFALHITGPLALLLYAHLAYKDQGLRHELINATASLDEALAPRCQQMRVCERGVPLCEFQVRCTAYNGDTGWSSAIGRRPDTAAAIRQALRNTSAAISPEL